MRLTDETTEPDGRRADWAAQTGVWQPRRPAFWVFVALLLACAGPLVTDLVRLAGDAPVVLPLSIGLLIPYGLPLALVIYQLDVYEREPLSIMVAALLWGALGAAGLSYVANEAGIELLAGITGDPALAWDWGPATTVPLVEEGAKAAGIALLVLIARRELDDVLDGFVWGAMVGVGFLLMEDILYFGGSYLAGGGVGGVLELFVIRVVASGLYSHFLYSGLVGMGIAWLVVRRSEPPLRRILAAGGLIAAGVVAHGFWNSPLLGGLAALGVWPYAVVRGVPLLLALVLLVRLQLLREQRWFERLTADFAADGTITAQDLEALASIPARRRARLAAADAGGSDAGRLVGQLQRHQLRLAMLHARHGDPSHPLVVRQRALVTAARSRLATAIGPRSPLSGPVSPT